jgi:hypothetical protein
MKLTVNAAKAPPEKLATLHHYSNFKISISDFIPKTYYANGVKKLFKLETQAPKYKP